MKRIALLVLLSPLLLVACDNASPPTDVDEGEVAESFYFIVERTTPSTTLTAYHPSLRCSDLADSESTFTFEVPQEAFETDGVNAPRVFEVFDWEDLEVIPDWDEVAWVLTSNGVGYYEDGQCFPEGMGSYRPIGEVDPVYILSFCGSYWSVEYWPVVQTMVMVRLEWPPVYRGGGYGPDSPYEWRFEDAVPLDWQPPRYDGTMGRSFMDYRDTPGTVPTAQEEDDWDWRYGPQADSHNPRRELSI